MYHIRHYWVSELCPSSGILEEENVSETGSGSTHRIKDREASNQLGPLEKANRNYPVNIQSLRLAPSNGYKTISNWDYGPVIEIGSFQRTQKWTSDYDYLFITDTRQSLIQITDQWLRLALLADPKVDQWLRLAPSNGYKTISDWDYGPVIENGSF
jgi:hypothetical protein